MGVRVEIPAEHGIVERIYREDGARLQRAVLMFTGSRPVAEDAVAEAFAQALRRGTALRDPLRWVWRAAFRIAAGQMADRRTSVTSMQTEPETFDQAAEPAMDLMAALAKLSPKQRGSIILHHLGGYPATEVARILGSTAPAVAVHLSVGRKRLRQLLEDRDG